MEPPSSSLTARASSNTCSWVGLLLALGVKQQRGDVVEGEGGHHEHRRDPERELNEAAGNRARASCAIGALPFGLPVDEVIAVSEQASRPGDEDRLLVAR